MSPCKTARMALLVALVAIVSMALAPRSALAAPDPLERLIQDATSASGAKRVQAVEALGNSGDPRALLPLIDLLHDVDPSIRKHVITALRTLTQHLKQVYTHLAQWIDSLLLRLHIHLAPEPPVERTQYPRVI